MANPSLRTSWGGQPQSHSPIQLVVPGHAQSDLVLTSEVFTQSFLSLQQHQYVYKAENHTDLVGAPLPLGIEWTGTHFRQGTVSPSVPLAYTRESWFSPQKLLTTANVLPVAGRTAGVQARIVAAERADAYVPWTSQVANLFEALKLVKGVFDILPDRQKAVLKCTLLAKGEPVLEVASSVWCERSQDPGRSLYHVEVQLRNAASVPIRGFLHGLSEQSVDPAFELGGQDAQRWSFNSRSMPLETVGVLEYWDAKRLGRSNSVPATLFVTVPWSDQASQFSGGAGNVGATRELEVAG